MKRTSVTLVYTTASKPGREWRISMFATGRLIATENPRVLEYAISERAASLGLAVERIVIDRALPPDTVREFLGRIPSSCRTDVLYVEEDGSGWLSAHMFDIGRTLITVSADDIRCYLATAGVVPPPAVPEPVRLTAVA